MGVKDQIQKYLDYKGINNNELERSIGASRSYWRNTKSISAEIVSEIVRVYSDLNIEWVFKNEGEMLNTSTPKYQLSDEFTEGAIPYYDNLPVSAGQFDLATYRHEENPTGWIKIPGVSAKGLFPVVGCSMKPDINPGDVVGLSNIDRWEMVDPDKVYLIITRDDRMIKHLMIDEANKEILWCISPNYPKFSIRKDEIVYIYRITFHGKLM